MQPSPTPTEETKAKVSDTNDNGDITIKKRRVSVKKKKTTDKRESAKPVEVDGEVDPAKVATPSTHLSETRSPGPYRGKCLYQSRKCENERAIKRNGKPHNLCEEHRSKQNQHQRKFDAKKFSRKRRRGSVSDEDTKNDGDELQHRNEEPSAKHHRVMTNQETRTPTANSKPPMPMIPTMRGNYPAAGSTPISAPLTRLPPIQSPRGPILPPSPIVYSHLSSRSGPEAYPRGHVYSDIRPGQSPIGSLRPNLQQQVSQASSGYSHSELVAASILVQPQSSSITPGYYRNEVSGTPSEGRGQTMTTPRVLPSLLVPPSAALSPNLYHRISGIVPSPAQRFAPVVVTPASSVSVSPARSAGNVLPPLVPFGLRKSATSTPSVSKPPNK